MKTLSESDWDNIHKILPYNLPSINPKYTTLAGIQEQIEEKEVGDYIYYLQQNAPFELGEDGKPLPQYDEQGNAIPIFTIVQCWVINDDTRRNA
jgi:hypothetical protein